MSRFVFVFVFYILHVWFFVDYFVFGINYTEFLGTIQNYTYSFQTAVYTFGYILFCFLFLIIGLYTKPIKSPFLSKRTNKVVNLKRLYLGFRIAIILCIILMFLLYLNADGQIASSELKENNNWMYEFRAIPLIFLSFILFNGYSLKFADKILIFIYATIAILGLTRSLMVELFSIFFFYYALYLNEDKFKIKYAVLTFCGIFFVNFIASYREVGNFEAVFNNASSLIVFEYKSYLDLLISEVIQNYKGGGYYTFLDSFILLIPSFIRDFFGVKLFYPDQELFFEIGRRSIPYYGGGFSLLAESYINLSFLAPLLFLFIGYAINIILISIRKSMIINRFTINAIFPLVAVTIIISFRNSFAMHCKYIIQIYILAFIIYQFITLKRKFVLVHRLI